MHSSRALRAGGLEIDPAHRAAGYEHYATFQPTFLYELMCRASRRPGAADTGTAHVADYRFGLASASWTTAATYFCWSS